MPSRLAFIFFSLISCAIAVAQTGPSDPRLVYGRSLADAPDYPYDQKRPLHLELTVAPDGIVTSARRLETSGDAGFDKVFAQYFSTLRLVPAIDANGVPVAGVLKLRVTRKMTDEFERNRKHVREEAERIGRMRCKDFVWEYSIMRQILGNDTMVHERLVKTSLWMFADRNPIKRAALYQLEANLDISIMASAVSCQQKPDAPFWEGAFSPTVHAQMRRLGIAEAGNAATVPP
jgi:hypothetical protein